MLLGLTDFIVNVFSSSHQNFFILSFLTIITVFSLSSLGKRVNIPIWQMKVLQQHLLVHYLMHVVEHEMSSHQHQFFFLLLAERGWGGGGRKATKFLIIETILKYHCRLPKATSWKIKPGALLKKNSYQYLQGIWDSVDRLLLPRIGPLHPDFQLWKHKDLV